MRTVLRRLSTSKGMTLPETLVVVTILTIAMVFTLTATTQATRTEAIAERIAVAAGYQQAVMAQAVQADYGDVGFYTDDEGAAELGYTAAGAPVELPISDEVTGSPIVEQPVVLGPTRPNGDKPAEDGGHTSTSAFTDHAIRVLENNQVTYRVSTWVTAVPPEGAEDISRAKRVVVQVEWVGGEGADVVLDGSCESPVRCSVQTLTRVASGADVDPISGASSSSTSTCTSATRNICETYVRSGRVLEGDWMATDDDLPTQTAPVEFYARTSHVATSMKATWTYKIRSGSALVDRTETVTLTSADGGTRWSGAVPADVEGAKGTIRPGTVQVTFTARSGASNISESTTAFWSYTKATGRDDDHVTAELLPASVNDVGWCADGGEGTPLRFEVTGHSVGMAKGTTATASADAVQVMFTVDDGSGTRSVAVEPTLVTATPVTVTMRGGVVVPIATNITWQVIAPPTKDCAVAQTATAVVTRTADRTTTTIPLRLAVATDRLPTPDPEVVVNVDTGSWTATWEEAEYATGYTVRSTIDGVQSTTTTSSRSVEGAQVLEPGQAVTVQVRGESAGRSYNWSQAVTVARAPRAPEVSVTRTADVATFSWPEVESATAYQVEVTNADGTKTASTTDRARDVIVDRGTTASIKVWASSGTTRSGEPGEASTTNPLWEDLETLNSWVDYGGEWAPARFTRTPDGVVVLSGVIKNGRAGDGTDLGHLPEGFRPNQTLIFTAASKTETARVEVKPNGRVVLATTRGDTTYLGLDSIQFVASDARDVNRRSAQLLKPVRQYRDGTSEYGSLELIRDESGRLHTQGLISPIHPDTLYLQNLFIIPEDLRTDHRFRFPAENSEGVGAVNGSTNVFSTPTSTPKDADWVSVRTMYDGPDVDWSAVPTASGWQPHGGQWSDPGFHLAEDGLVSLRGWISGGATARGTVIGNLPKGARPAETIVLTAVTSGNVPVRIDIQSDGDIQIGDTRTSSGWLSLDSLSFVAEQ